MEGTKQSVYVNSDPSGADLTVNGRKQQGQTPSQIEIDRKEQFNGKHTINYIFEKEGFKKTVFNDKSKVNPFSIGGFFIFSIFNFWDWVSGAAYKYSGNVFVNLEPLNDNGDVFYDDIAKIKNSFSRLYLENSFYDIFSNENINYFEDKIKPDSAQKIVSVNINSQNPYNKNKFVDIAKIHLLNNNDKWLLLGFGIPENNKNSNVPINFLINQNLITPNEYNSYGYFQSKGLESGELRFVHNEEISYLHIIESPCQLTLFFIVPTDCKSFELVDFFEKSLSINCDE